MNVHRALSDVAQIRAQLDRTTNHRGFRSSATGFSGLIVVAGATLQANSIGQTTLDVDACLSIWLSVALISSCIAGAEMIIRGIRSRSQTVWRTHQKLVSNLLPSLIAGSILTFVIANHAIEQTTSASLMGTLPGLWAMIFGLGLFGCRFELPAASRWVAAYFLLGGSVCLSFGGSHHEFVCWQMVLLFGVGQMLLGWTLFWNVEQTD
jgi:hypothetical protein